MNYLLNPSNYEVVEILIYFNQSKRVPKQTVWSELRTLINLTFTGVLFLVVNSIWAILRLVLLKNLNWQYCVNIVVETIKSILHHSNNSFQVKSLWTSNLPCKYRHANIRTHDVRSAKIARDLSTCGTIYLFIDNVESKRR